MPAKTSVKVYRSFSLLTELVKTETDFLFLIFSFQTASHRQAGARLVLNIVISAKIPTVRFDRSVNQKST